MFGMCGAAFATWAARVPAAAQRLHLVPGQLALALFGLAVGSVIALVGAGPLITRIGSRAGAAVGAGVLCLGLPLISLAGDLALLVGALFVLGVGNSLLDVSMNAHAARVEHEYGRPIFAGFHAFWNIGGLAGSGLGAVLAGRNVPIGTHFAWVGGALLVIAWVAIGRLFLRGPDRGQGDAAFALPSRALIPLGVIAFCGFVAEGTVNDWSAVYLTNVTAAAPAVASLGYFAFSITMIAVRLVADRLAARFTVTRFVRVAALVAAAGFAVALLVATPAVGVFGFGVVGLGVSAIVPLAWSAAGRVQPGSPGRAIAAVATCGYLGFLVGPMLIGGLAGAFGLRLALIAAVLVTLPVYYLAPRMRVPVTTGSAP